MAASPGRHSAADPRVALRRSKHQTPAHAAWKPRVPPPPGRSCAPGRPRRGPLLLGFELLDADVAELQLAAFTLEADEAPGVLQIVGGADELPVELHLAARAGAGHLEGLP